MAQDYISNFSKIVLASVDIYGMLRAERKEETMNDKTYNGWTNYETWVVKLWMDNDEYSHDNWVRTARYIYEHDAKEQPHFTKMEDAVVILADRLKNDHEEAKDEILEHMKLNASLWADLLGAALSETNWHEIAENLLEDVEVQA